MLGSLHQYDVGALKVVVGTEKKLVIVWSVTYLKFNCNIPYSFAHGNPAIIYTALQALSCFCPSDGALGEHSDFLTV